MSELPFDFDKAPDPDFKVPDALGSFEGWRAWKTSTDLRKWEAPKLWSYNHDYYWIPRRDSVAECEKCGENIPGEKHSCGFYSAKSFVHLMTMEYPKYNTDEGVVRVVGRVANTGKVIECASGWRAEKSYPVLLLVPYEAYQIAKPLSETYGVPVRLANWLKPKADLT